MNAPRGHGRREQLRLRATDTERRAFATAAKLSGLSLSSWIRAVARKAAIRQLRDAGKDGLIEQLEVA